MARPRKKKGVPEGATDTAIDSNETASVAVAEKPFEQPPAKEEPPFEPTGQYSPAAEEPAGVKAQPRGRFRSWVNDPSRGYSRLSDEEGRRIVLMFDQKPPGDVLTAVKDAGFQYHPDYHGQKNAWTRRNDHEGRIQAEGIDSLVRSLIPGLTSQER